MWLIFANCYKRHYYLVLAGFIVDYKEQIFIIIIKTNIEYWIFNVHQKKRINNPVLRVADLLVNLNSA